MPISEEPKAAREFHLSLHVVTIINSWSQMSIQNCWVILFWSFLWRVISLSAITILYLVHAPQTLYPSFPTCSPYRYLDYYLSKYLIRILQLPSEKHSNQHIHLHFLLLQRKSCPSLYLSLIPLPMFRIPIFINLKMCVSLSGIFNTFLLI